MHVSCRPTAYVWMFHRMYDRHCPDERSDGIRGIPGSCRVRVSWTIHRDNGKRSSHATKRSEDAANSNHRHIFIHIMWSHKCQIFSQKAGNFKVCNLALRFLTKIFSNYCTATKQLDKAVDICYCFFGHVSMWSGSQNHSSLCLCLIIQRIYHQTRH